MLPGEYEKVKSSGNTIYLKSIWNSGRAQVLDVTVTAGRSEDRKTVS
jgi:hypothetical protein